MRYGLWIKGTLIGASLFLAACAEGALRLPVRNQAVYGGQARVKAPEGYCIITEASLPEHGFVAMAPCYVQSISTTRPETDAVITVQVGSAGSAVIAGNEEKLRDLLRTDAGGGVLASDGNAQSIQIDAVDVVGGTVEVHFTDMGRPRFANLEQSEWRAFFDADGRLMTVSVRGYAHLPVENAEGLSLLHQTVAVNRE